MTYLQKLMNAIEALEDVLYAKETVRGGQVEATIYDCLCLLREITD